MIISVQNRKDLRRFIRFPLELYRGDPHFVPPIWAAQTRELVREVLKKKAYTALLAVKGSSVQGRLLYIFKESKRRKKTVAYFSFFECVHDASVARELFDFMEARMKDGGVAYAEGTYCPYDSDTRRGILIDNFADDPSIFLSYNKPYYPEFLESCGYRKAYDTLAMKADAGPETRGIMDRIAERFLSQHPGEISVSPIDWKHLDREIADVQKILEAATTEINYQAAPDVREIAAVARNLRFIADRKLIILARKQATGEPVGFALVLPDFNQVLKKTRGRIRPLRILWHLRRVTRVRGMLQYIVPEYQSSGLLGLIFKTIYDRMEERGIIAFEGGTIMENNPKSWGAFLKFGGTVSKTYRIYGKELETQ